MPNGMREIHTDVEVLTHAISDSINVYVREVLIPRGLMDEVAWEAAGPNDDLIRLKYEIADRVAKRWAVSWRNDEA